MSVIVCITIMYFSHERDSYSFFRRRTSVGDKYGTYNVNYMFVTMYICMSKGRAVEKSVQQSHFHDE
jgi:hypothetical protein